MDTPRLRNTLKLYLGGFDLDTHPSEFSYLKENILLDALDRQYLMRILEYHKDLYLMLATQNSGNKEVELTKDTIEQINALCSQNLKRFNALYNRRNGQVNNLIKTFELLETKGIL